MTNDAGFSLLIEVLTINGYSIKFENIGKNGDWLVVATIYDKEGEVWFEYGYPPQRDSKLGIFIISHMISQAIKQKIKM